MEILKYAAFFAVGCGASMLNSVAGGGSVFSLPIMIFLGLPPTVANGTNRIGLIVGNFSSAYNLYRHGYLNGRLFKQLFLPSLVGALLGLLFLINIDDQIFKTILTFAIAAVAVMSGLKPGFLGKSKQIPERLTPGGFLGFMLIGIYGSVVQVGVGFVQIFALVRYTGLELIQVNALKNMLTNVFLVISTIGLAFTGKIDWPLALVTAIGSSVGGFISSRLQYKKGNRFIARVVRFATVAVALKMFYDLIF